MGAGVGTIQKSEYIKIILLILDYIDPRFQYEHVSSLYFKVISNVMTIAHIGSRTPAYMKIPILFCNLLDFEDSIEKLFQTGLTPILFDTSPDDKVCTFFSYQPDCVILEAKSMVLEYSKRLPLVQCLEIGRRYVVNAMKHGKTLIIRLDSTVPDFVNIFNDGILNLQGFDVNAKEGAYFPIEIFSGGGRLLRDEANGWPEKLFREEDMKPHKNFAYCRDSFRVMLVSQLDAEAALELFWHDGPRVRQIPGVRRTRKPHFPSLLQFGIVSVEYDSEP